MAGREWLSLVAISGAGISIMLGAAAPPSPPADQLAAEIGRWTAFVRDNKSTDELWTQSKGASQPVLDSAAEALSHGWRSLALQRLAAARLNLAASRYVLELEEARRKDPAALEAEWTRTAGALAGVPAPDALQDIHPAAVRAVGEASLYQVHVFHESSLVYGRSTAPDSGYFYLGAAQAQKEVADLCRGLSTPASGRMPLMRSLAGELDSLETEILTAYKPPASIDKHREFIIASSALKEARELDAAGFRSGALLRYLQAVLRVAPLRPASVLTDPGALAGRLDAFERRLSQNGMDHTIGRIFLEAARADAANADTIVVDVLPRYFAALEPAPAAPAPPLPANRMVTVTLVRWPYT